MSTKNSQPPRTRSSAVAAARSRSSSVAAAAARSRSRSSSVAAAARSSALLSLTSLVEDLQVGDVTVVSAFSRSDVTRAGAVMSPHAPASQVAGGMRPARGTSEREERDAMVAAGLDDSSAEEEEEEPRPKRRRLLRVSEDDEQEEKKEEEFEEHAVARVLNRRGDGRSREYLVQWEDQSSEWMAVSNLGNCSELVKTYDRYLEEHPERNVSYAEFVSSDLPSIQLMADSPKDDCALHAVQMAFELMGGLDREVLKLRVGRRSFSIG
uniref:Chromo domain-containing protein n=1 Tax=Globisporangium ultimum (strain ATCC 200006 / CBS 805.95 / DAOM BR144) TaxID=431595 RepID=K3XD60_GLOUD